MRARTLSPVSFVVRPSVTAALLYFGLCAIWFLWILVTFEHPRLDSGAPFRLISDGQWMAVTGLNAAFLVAFLVDAYFTRKAPVSLRRGQYAGLLLAIVVLGVVQYGAVRAYGPIPTGQEIADEDAAIVQLALTELREMARGGVVESGSVVTVKPRTSLWYGWLDNVSENRGVHFVDRFRQSPAFPEDEADVVADLIDTFFERNREVVELTIPSDSDEGYEIDREWRTDSYFRPFGGGWRAWYEAYPDSAGWASISLPAHDPKSGLVVIYMDLLAGGLDGSGHVYLYRYDGQRLERLANAVVWVS